MICHYGNDIRGLTGLTVICETKWNRFPIWKLQIFILEITDFELIFQITWFWPRNCLLISWLLKNWWFMLFLQSCISRCNGLENSVSCFLSWKRWQWRTHSLQNLKSWICRHRVWIWWPFRYICPDFNKQTPRCCASV